MSVVILGGNECMERRYIDLCKSYSCKAKVYTKMKAGMKDIGSPDRCQAKVVTKTSGGLKNKLGSPDLMIFFTNTMSHKLVQGALSEMKGADTIIERCHTSSLSALRGILEKYAPQQA